MDPIHYDFRDEIMGTMQVDGMTRGLYFSGGFNSRFDENYGQSINYYNFVGNNPINKLDPFGFACGPGWGDIIIPDDFIFYSFRKACELHDDCYQRCKPKKECDKLFYKDMLKECKKLDKWYYKITGIYYTCLANAKLYYWAVRTFGDSAYETSCKRGREKC